MAERIGWILVHSKKVFGKGKEYSAPQEELRDLKAKILKEFGWNWNRNNPLKPGGPYMLLFSWQGEVFGDAIADISPDFNSGDEYVDYNFSFNVRGFKWRNPVAFSALGIHPRQHDLIILTPSILQTYRRLAR